MMALLLAVLVSTGFDVGDQAAVKVMRQYLYPTPAFYAQPLLELTLGQVLTVLEVGSSWYRVSATTSTSGWVHSTALAAASSGSGTVGSGSGGVTSDEVTLAGRGFNSDVEARYSTDNPQLDFAKVDAMEALEITSSQLEQFLVQGGMIEGSSAGEGGTAGSTSESGSPSSRGGNSR